MDKKIATCQKAVERINKKIDLQKQKLKDLKSELRKTKEALKMAKKKPMKGGGSGTLRSSTSRAGTPRRENSASTRKHFPRSSVQLNTIPENKVPPPPESYNQPKSTSDGYYLGVLTADEYRSNKVKDLIKSMEMREKNMHHFKYKSI